MVSYAKRRESMTDTIDSMHEIMESLTNKALISFGGGAPAKAAYPLEVIQKVTHTLLKDPDQSLEALSYGPTEGLQSLRKAVRDYLLKPNGINESVDNILITAGGIQGLFLVGKLFLNPGDVVLVEAPTFIHAKMVFDSFQVTYETCALEKDGLDLDLLEEKIKKYQPKMIYTMPTFHNPTGITMSREKRQRMAQLAEKYNVIILEDDPYSEIRYSGEKLRPIKAYTDSPHVIYANSFSKIFSPGARLGYLVADKAIIKELSEMKLATDTCTNNLTQSICASFFNEGHYNEHLKYICDLYQLRRDTMAKAIDVYFPKGTQRTNPLGGFYIWVKLPKGLNAKKLLPKVNEAVKITYACGDAFFVENSNEHDAYIRFSFAGQEPPVIESSMKILGDYFKKQM